MVSIVVMNSCKIEMNLAWITFLAEYYVFYLLAYVLDSAHFKQASLSIKGIQAEVHLTMYLCITNGGQIKCSSSYIVS